MGDISKNFSFSEFEATSHKEYAAQNRITDLSVKNAIVALVMTVLQPLRDAWGKALVINSGYRCEALNKAVGGVANSQHLKGEAADVAAADPYALAKLARDLRLPYDQMILYPTFVHFSHKNGGSQRGQVLYNSSYKGTRLA
ncbi:MAG: D-Ala-D-Ala carboxypeptidase family metallohydrolase [Porphyromonadaceae bacterium]|nr:D-Ala-D-Ala carboxypeptidase family metallohydrolase [Porphyromonadaceae bacterium]